TPYYVISKNIDNNTICVSPRPGLGLGGESSNIEYVLINSNILKDSINQTKKYTAQIRYHGEFLSCNVSFEENNPKIIFNSPILVSPGQSIVLYDGNTCLGGGIVQ
ncbi:MAG: tRNA 2-thiouridine(34) synthase MnmA, partial [Candidatus Parcubacteria bacterium]